MNTTIISKRCIAIGGVPAVGKSTIVSNFFKYNDYWQDYKYKKLRGHYSKELNLFIIGIYGTSVFSGTDRLSMAVNPDFVEFVKKYSDKYNILFEGDRLFTLNNLLMLEKYYDLKTCIICSNETKQRHIQRKDNQSETFIKGRTTKINNILSNIKNFTMYDNNKLGDDKIIYNKIIPLL